MAPNPSWLTPTRRHIQSRILRSLVKLSHPVFVSLERSCSCCDGSHQSALRTWHRSVRLGNSYDGPIGSAPFSILRSGSADGSGYPVVAEQRNDFDVSDDADLHARIEMAHRPRVEIDDAARH